jgi:hypothetical protein
MCKAQDEMMAIDVHTKAYVFFLLLLVSSINVWGELRGKWDLTLNQVSELRVLD